MNPFQEVAQGVFIDGDICGGGGGFRDDGRSVTTVQWHPWLKTGENRPRGESK